MAAGFRIRPGGRLAPWPACTAPTPGRLYDGPRARACPAPVPGGRAGRRDPAFVARSVLRPAFSAAPSSRLPLWLPVCGSSGLGGRRSSPTSCGDGSPPARPAPAEEAELRLCDRSQPRAPDLRERRPPSPPVTMTRPHPRRRSGPRPPDRCPAQRLPAPCTSDGPPSRRATGLRPARDHGAPPPPSAAGPPPPPATPYSAGSRDTSPALRCCGIVKEPCWMATVRTGEGMRMFSSW